MDFSAALTKLSMDLYPQLINFWSLSDLRWPSQLMKLGKHKKGNNTVTFTNMELMLGVVVAEIH